MRKLPKEVRKELLDLASSLPVDFYQAMDLITLSGKDAKQSGLEGEFEEDKEYWMKTPAYYAKNHFRRLKKCFEARGIEGVTDYVDDVMKRYKASLN